MVAILETQPVFLQMVFAAAAGLVVLYPVRQVLSNIMQRRSFEHSRAEEGVIAEKKAKVSGMPNFLKAMDAGGLWAKMAEALKEAIRASIELVTTIGASLLTGTRRMRRMVNSAARKNAHMSRWEMLNPENRYRAHDKAGLINSWGTRNRLGL